MDFKNTALGIEFGSTKIKAVLIDQDHNPAASGSYDWENREGVLTSTPARKRGIPDRRAVLAE